jgi:hypothetical protein
MDQKRMSLLFNDVCTYSKEELKLRPTRDHVSLPAILLYFTNKRNSFVMINLFPKDIDGNSISVLVKACFYYAVSESSSNT